MITKNKGAQISVIVPVYNVEKFLPRCIDSILAQTFTDFVLILVDDGSNDNSGKICDKYAQKDNRIKVIHKENRGVSSARNHGLKMVTTSYVVFVDSDDYIKNNYLQNMMLYKFADFVVQGIVSKNNNYETINTYYEFTNDSIFEEIINNELQHDFLYRGPYCKLFKTEIINKYKLQFNENICIGEDFLFNLSYLSFCTSMVKIDYCGYFYESNENSLTHTKYSINKRITITEEFHHTLNLIDNKIHYHELYNCIMGSQLNSCIKYNFCANENRTDRYIGIKYINSRLNKYMLKYINFPYVLYYGIKFFPICLIDILCLIIFNLYINLKKIIKR